MSVIVELRSVSFSYRAGPIVIEDATVSFEAGKAHAVTGPSGCGKSTLLYISGLMLRPTSGRVVVTGTRYERASDSRRARARAELIGFVFQDALLDPSLTVWENVIEGLPWRQRRRPSLVRAAEGLERLGVADLRHRRAARLSGGQAQRIALVRAIAKQPALILADEPTGNLDRLSATAVLDELVEYGSRPDRAAIIVTHDQQVAERCAGNTRMGAKQPFGPGAR